jgi:hypothetical protein
LPNNALYRAAVQAPAGAFGKKFWHDIVNI